MKRNDFSGARVLVTGGAGFIGSALVWALNRRGCDDVVVCDLLGTNEKWRNLAALRFADYIEADALLPGLESGALGKFDLVLHMGACSTTTEKDASFLIRNNYEFTKSLCAWALARDARFVYASSAATYGDGSAGMEDDESRLDSLRPLNMYGYSKHLFDLHARRLGFLSRVAGLKYFNVFGPNEDHKADMRSLVHKSFGQARSEGIIRLFKSHRPEFRDGEQKRDFLYVKDAAAMTLHLAATPSATGLFNIGSGSAHAWLDLAHAVFAALGKKPKIEFIEMPDAIREKYQYFTQADISRLRTAGYSQAITPLRDAVADYVQHYLAPDKRLGDGETV
ncbi:MAG: ADP-glyceromanno-heptose 6-epimerase [Verrucomicrobia bacterium]|nr:ADP-glyceromanno-heptose 6-epimerase [Verrucomicrobiota bacterium]MDE3097875.1 ADP-glyceromanno-heptose 6-epimerase [Verrucomicrobiota bacterium]